MLHSLIDLQRKIASRQGTARPEGSKSSTRRRRRTSSGSSDSEGSNRDSSSSSHKRKIKRHHRDHSRDEFKKGKPPTFDVEVKTGQEVEAWIFGIKKYFQVQDYLEKKGKGFHIQFEWKGIHLVGALQASKEDQQKKA